VTITDLGVVGDAGDTGLGNAIESCRKTFCRFEGYNLLLRHAERIFLEVKAFSLAVV
jgi:hypothetical protein